ncbi:hypothetical protein [Propionimicrobium lymphophilum]|uniref:hypothetical protein n=1 Tax=Propionimicrobium lymphophilum TaxID=33012 RepID=UPI001E4EDEB2|nr:hypothetical protein [Propionimicrobium lymphophilum]
MSIAKAMRDKRRHGDSLDNPTQASSRPEAAMPSADLKHPGRQATRSNQTSHLEDGYQLIELGWRPRKGSHLAGWRSRKGSQLG